MLKSSTDVVNGRYVDWHGFCFRRHSTLCTEQEFMILHFGHPGARQRKKLKKKDSCYRPKLGDILLCSGITMTKNRTFAQPPR